MCTRSDLPALTVEILDVSLSDYRLLRWTSHLHRLPPVYTSTSRRSWRSFDVDVFLADLQLSPLCDERQWQGCDADALAELYDKTISQLLDDQAPVQHVTCHHLGSTTTVVKLSKHCILRRKLLVVLDHCRTSTCLPLLRGAFSDDSTLNCFARSVLPSGPHASTLNSRSHAAFGGPLMSCLAMGVHAIYSYQRVRPAQFFSMTRSQEYELPLLTQMRRLSPLPQMAACCGCFQPSHLLT